VSLVNPLCSLSANLFKVHFYPILPSTSRSSEWSLSFELSHQTLYTLLHSPMRATCPAHLILRDLICLMIFGVRHKLWSYHSATFCTVIASSLLGPNIFHSTPFPYTLSLCFSLNVRDQDLHPYESTLRILSHDDVGLLLFVAVAFSSQCPSCNTIEACRSCDAAETEISF
jgi:hypothetical protein